MSDDTIISSYFEIEDEPSGETVYNEGSKELKGQVERIHFIDDPSNRSKQFVEYDVSIQDAFGGRSTYKNVRCAGSGSSSTNDSEETIIEANSFAFKGKLETKNLYENKNGAIVVISFLDGSLDKPYISNVLSHPKIPGAKREDGIHKKGEFRGIGWEINKDGELIITYNSEKKPDGTRERLETGPTQIKIDKDGRISISDNEGQLIRMDRVSKKIEIITKENFETTVGKDRLEIISGNETTTTTGNRVHTAANHTLTGSGDIKLGSAASSENLVLGVAFQTLYNAHTHIGNLGVPTGFPQLPMTAAELAQKNFTE